MTTYFENHLRNFRSVLSAREVDAILLANCGANVPNDYNYNLYYVSNLLGFLPWCIFVLTGDECGIWVHAEDVERVKKQTWIDRVEAMEPEGGAFQSSPEELARTALTHVRELVGSETLRLGVDGGRLPSSVALALIQEGAQVEEVSLDLEKSRMVLDDRELDQMRKGAQIADQGVEKVMEAIREGVTERELSVLAEYAMRAAGAECFWWPSIIASGPEAAFWADSPTHREIRDGDLLWMDFTPVYQGYAGDIARAFVCGTASQDQLEVFELAEETLEATAAALGDGVTIREVMEAAAQVVKGSRYEPFYLGPGHMIGLYNSVYPIFLSSISEMEAMPPAILEMPLQPGMVVAAEIIFTVPGLGGVRLEDNYVITANQPERLTRAPIVATVP